MTEDFDVIDVPFHFGDDVWFTEDGVDYPATVTGTLDEGFEYEIVTGNRATTAHLTQLRVR